MCGYDMLCKVACNILYRLSHPYILKLFETYIQRLPRVLYMLGSFADLAYSSSSC